MTDPDAPGAAERDPAVAALARVLYVDDDPNLLAGVRRHQRTHFDLTFCQSGPEALEIFQNEGPFAVVVSDLRMPRMDGIELLSRLHELDPDSTRIMLTGNGDLEAAQRAVNDGRVFRFLTKPCAPETLREAIAAGVRIHELTVAERALLEQTLRGAVRVLTDTLSLVNPFAFGRAARVSRRIRDLAERANVCDPWMYEISGLLSQIGCVAIPPEVFERAAAGGALSEDERDMLRAHPRTGCELIRAIPRLESAAEMIRYQDLRFDGRGACDDEPVGAEIPLGARMLKAAIDLDRHETSGKCATEALEALQSDPAAYDPEILAHLGLASRVELAFVKRQVPVGGLRVGMRISDDVRSEADLLLVAAGQAVTVSLLERLHNWQRGSMHVIREPISVIIPSEMEDSSCL